MNSILLALSLIAATPPFEVRTLDGQTLVGSLVELTPERLTIAGPNGQVALEGEQILSILSPRKPAATRHSPGARIELGDGSIVFGRQYVTDKALAKITLSDGNVLKTPTSAIQSVRLQQPTAALDAEWTRVITQKTDADLLVVHKGQMLDYHKGVLHDVTEDTVQFELDGELLPVKRPKVFGLVYRHGVSAPSPAAVCRITDAAGSQWSVRSLQLSDNLQWTTPSGLSVAEPLDRIVAIDFSGGKIAYLSDLKPDSVRWTPYFGAGKWPAAIEEFYTPRLDRNFESGPLQLGGVQYRKGLALRSRTEMVYRLPDSYSRFRAVVGIDDAMRPRGKVRLIVRGDDKPLLDIVVSGDEPPRTVDLDLSAVRRLTILVDFGESLSTGDYLLLCNARLCK